MLHIRPAYTSKYTFVTVSAIRIEATAAIASGDLFLYRAWTLFGMRINTLHKVDGKIENEPYQHHEAHYLDTQSSHHSFIPHITLASGGRRCMIGIRRYTKLPSLRTSAGKHLNWLDLWEPWVHTSSGQISRLYASKYLGSMNIFRMMSGDIPTRLTDTIYQLRKNKQIINGERRHTDKAQWHQISI